MKVEQAFWDDPDVQRLTTDQQVEIRARYGGKEEPGAAPSAADVSVVLVARDDDGTPLGCGALRALGDGVAEVKRMYVTPDARPGRLEGGARRARGGRPGARLDDAAPGDRAAAAGGPGLYTSAGYRPIAAFGGYVGDPDAEASLFYERSLDR